MITIDKMTPEGEQQRARLAAYAKKAKEHGKTKTVAETLEEVANEICNNYCKYPENWDEETMGDLFDSEVCAKCPLNRL